MAVRVRKGGSGVGSVERARVRKRAPAPRRAAASGPGLVHMVVDLETVVDPDFRDQEHKKDGAAKFPAPPCHQIVCAGYALLSDYQVESWGVLDEGEDETVKKLVGAVEDLRPVLVTFNGRGFDVPVVAGRAALWGVPWSWLYQTKAPRYRYDDSAHLDLMDYLADHNATRPAGLGVWARVCGWPGKEDVSGTDVALMYHSGQRAEIAAYCLSDVAKTCALLLRTQLLRGVISLDQYVPAAQALLDHALADDRTAELASRVNVARFLCEPWAGARAAE